LKGGKMENKTKTIEDLLRKNTGGLTIQDIAEKLGFARNTVAVHLAELVGSDKVYIREIGNAKLHYPRKEKK
jgi:predicted ArsR family transcriptional regulator